MFDLETICRAVIGQVLSHSFWLDQRLYVGGLRPSVDLARTEFVHQDQVTPYAQSPLREELALLVRVANGAIDRARTHEQTVGEIAETLQGICELLFSPIGTHAYTIPPTFWSEDGIGEVCGAVWGWLHQDDLINYTEAASLLYPNLNASPDARSARVRRLVEKGKLTGVIDPSIKNPQHARRVLRSQVERKREDARDAATT